MPKTSEGVKVPKALKILALTGFWNWEVTLAELLNGENQPSPCIKLKVYFLYLPCKNNHFKVDIYGYLFLRNLRTITEKIGAATGQNPVLATGFSCYSNKTKFYCSNRIFIL